MLTALLDGNAGVLDGETFQTLICEAEAIVNSRLLTLDNLGDPDSLAPLMPNHILTMKTWPVLPPPGVFQREDQYSRKHGDESSTSRASSGTVGERSSYKTSKEDPSGVLPAATFRLAMW